MTAAELLKPRFEVIAEYPRCPFKKGTILKLISDLKLKDWYEDEEQTDMTKGIFIKPYPHLYKPLNWWEHRKVEDMPKKLMANFGHFKDQIRDVEKWYFDEGLVFFDSSKKQYAAYIYWDSNECYLPID